MQHACHSQAHQFYAMTLLSVLSIQQSFVYAQIVHSTAVDYSSRVAADVCAPSPFDTHCDAPKAPTTSRCPAPSFIAPSFQPRRDRVFSRDDNAYLYH